MAKTVGVFRIGNDPTLRFTPSNEPVINLSLASNYGRKGDDGKQPTQWYDASLWGKRAEALAPYLRKGDRIYVELSELHIDTYQKDGQTHHKLVCKVTDVELIGSGDRQNGTQSSQSQRQPAPARSAAPATSAAFDDQDIPF